MNASYVPFENVHDHSSFVRHAVGSPSLIAGKYAARIGCVANGVMPTNERDDAREQQPPAKQRRRPSHEHGDRHAGAGSMPAMWLA